MSGVSPLRSAVATILIFAWVLGVEVVVEGWPDRSVGWWIIYVSGFVVIGVVGYWTEKLWTRRKERQQ